MQISFENYFIDYEWLNHKKNGFGVVFIHGIMGNKKNWRNFALNFIKSFPGSQVLLIDLRNHGQSSKNVEPFTIEATSLDIVNIINIIGFTADWLIGHSFGSKVALLAAMKSKKTKAVWLLDSSPGTVIAKSMSKDEPFNALEVMDILETISPTFSSRHELVEKLVQNKVSLPIAKWMTTNLEQIENSEFLRLSFNPIQTKKMLESFLSTCLWQNIETLSSSCEIHLVKAQYGNRLGLEDEKKIKTIQSDNVFLHELKNSGHFLHADNPTGLLEIFKLFLPEKALRSCYNA